MCRFRFLPILPLCFLTCALAGCDFVYHLLQKEGAEEKALLGSALPYEHNPKVEEIQRIFNILGYHVGNPDGKFGPKTREAIARFQKDRNLPVTRFLDKPTWKELSIFQNRGLLREGEIDIHTVQSALKAAGYDPGSLDGNLGPRTQRKLKSFQTAHGLKADGVIGYKTLKVLLDYLPVAPP